MNRFLAVLALALAPFSLHAHPHAWIDVRSTIILSTEGLIWRSALPVILAIGLRPCTGAILVLLVAYSLGLRWAGIGAVLAMSLGTAATMSLLATAAIRFRQAALRFFQRGHTASHRTGLVFDLLGLLGGMAIGTMGLGLLQQGLSTAPHPLL